MSGLFVMFALAFAPVSATAQEVQKIVAVVNEEVISGYDLLQRISLTVLMSGIQNTRKARQQLVNPTLNRLVEERLKLQEAARYNLTVSDIEINKAVSAVEKQNNIPSGQLDTILANRGIDMETLLGQIRASIAWDKVIRRRIAPRVNVTEEEIEALQKKMKANKGKKEFLLSEIYIPVDFQSDEPKVRKLMNDLMQQMRNGAKFPRIARQFSRGVTAAKGGAIGWVMSEDLDPELANIVVKAKKGGISKPVRTSDGYYIIAVRDIRKILAEQENNARLELSQLVIPLSPAEKQGTKSSQIKLINSLSRFIDSCDYVPNLLQEISTSESGKMGRVELKNLPEKFRSLVENLKTGEASTPFLDKDKYRIFIVCDRQDQNAQSDSKVIARQQIGVKRIENRASRYLKDLRREATVEVR